MMSASKKHYHRLLEKQLKTVQYKNGKINWDQFLDLVSDVYFDSEKEIKMTNRAMNLMSMELLETNKTLRKQAEELKQMESFLVDILDSMPSFLMVLDKDQNIIKANKAVKEEFKESLNSLRTLNIVDVFPHLKEHIDKIDTAISDKRVRFIEKIPHVTNGMTLYFEVMIYPLSIDHFQGAVVRIDDITERIRMEQQMLSKADAAKLRNNIPLPS